jgi:hypothetical protein
LRILHCNDDACAGADESITTPDNGSAQYLSLVLDSSGFPVISYYDGATTNLNVMHRNDTHCSGSDESITTADNTLLAGRYGSLALDHLGFPVISYSVGGPYHDLRVLHCNDANCAGADDSITSPDTIGTVGDSSSLLLDASGFPVVSYVDSINGDLKVLHCNDPNCADGDDSVTSPDTAGQVGFDTSLELDSGGYPVVAYADLSGARMKVMHCNDVSCTGGGESITTPDLDATSSDRSLALDSSGQPVISYADSGADELKVMHCNDPNCSGGDEWVIQPDLAASGEGGASSLDLDASGFPVVSYSAYPPIGALSVLHCADAACGFTKDDDGDGCGYGQEVAPEGSASSGGGRDPLNFWDFFDTPDSSNVRDKSVAGTDFFRVLGRFNATGAPGIDPLSAPPPAPAYHTAFDRGPSGGPNPWNLTAADGAITGQDFFAVLAQFGHTCA